MSLEFPYADQKVIRLYLGSRPAYGIAVIRSDKYSLPGEVATLGFIQIHQDATQSSYPRQFFAEVTLTAPLNFTDELTSSFLADNAAARETILAGAAKAMSSLNFELDLFCGAMGIRGHRQLVIEPVNENTVALQNGDYACNFQGPGVESLQRVGIDSGWLQRLRDDLERLPALPAEKREHFGLVMSWLMRAWQERNYINRFVALFIPMECLLHDVGSRIPPDDRRVARRIRRVLTRHAGDQCKELVDFFDECYSRRRPSLEQRFARLAESLAIPGWKGDIEAFAHFNRMRNDLFHRGRKSISWHLALTEDDVFSLEDLVERYSSALIFGDCRVYDSQWRPARPSE